MKTYYTIQYKYPYIVKLEVPNDFTEFNCIMLSRGIYVTPEKVYNSFEDAKGYLVEQAIKEKDDLCSTLEEYASNWVKQDIKEDMYYQLLLEDAGVKAYPLYMNWKNSREHIYYVLREEGTSEWLHPSEVYHGGYLLKNTMQIVSEGFNTKKYKKLETLYIEAIKKYQQAKAIVEKECIVITI